MLEIGCYDGLRLVDVGKYVGRELKLVNMPEGTGEIQHKDWVVWVAVDVVDNLEGNKPSDVG